MRCYSELGVKGWAMREGWLKSGVLPGTESHLLLNGGILQVPGKKNDNFHAYLAHDLENGYVNYVVEKRTEVFRFFVDLDIFEEVEVSPEKLNRWVTQMQAVLIQLFPDLQERVRTHKPDPYSAIICTAPAQDSVIKNGETCCKTGVHVVWPWINVTADQARVARKAFIQWFQQKLGTRPAHNIWEDVFDESVYTTNGLRMVGSDKPVTCASCKGKKGDVCENTACRGQGYFPANRIYRVTSIVDQHGGIQKPLLDRIRSTPTMEIGFTSIRIDNENRKQEFVVHPARMEYPDWFTCGFFYDEEEMHKNRFHPSAAVRKHRKEQFFQSLENMKASEKLGIGAKFPKLKSNDERVIAIQNWIKNDKLPVQSLIPGIFRSLKVIDVTRKVGDKSYYYLVRTDCQFCLNKGSEHGSNHIYFLINERGLYQKCFCQCETPRITGQKCKDYHSAVYQMPSTVKRFLYPEIHQKEELARATLNQNVENMTPEVEKMLLAIKRDELILRAERLKARKALDMQNQYTSKREPCAKQT